MTYRTAMVAVYDVLETVFVSATVTEYNGTPGIVKPDKYVLTASMQSRGDEDWQDWILRALSHLVADNMTAPRRSGEHTGAGDGVTSQ
jgi:hypothetical protein